MFKLEKDDFTTKIRSHLMSAHPELVSKFDEICSKIDQDNRSEFFMESTDSLESVNAIEKSEKPERSQKFVQVAMETNRHYLIDHDYCQTMKPEILNQNEEIVPSFDPAGKDFSQNDEEIMDFDIAEDENLETINTFDTVLIESNEANEEKTEMKSEISDPLALNEPMIEHQEIIFNSSHTESSNNQNYSSTVIAEENHQTSIVESSNV